MKIKECMTTKIDTIKPTTSVVKAAALMRRKDIGSLLVENENEEFVGIITERDITRKIIATGKDVKTAVVKDIMGSPLIMVEGDDDILKACRLLKKYHIKRLVVVDHGEVTGIISSRKIAENLPALVKKL